MKRHAYTLTLLDDTVISRRAATLGGHQSLDYIPGQTLLGACAASLYQRIGSDSYAAFHSGKLRFGNALPLADGQPAWPVPMCWHDNKADPALTHGRLDGSRVWNLSRLNALPDHAQPRQLRDGYIDTAGQLYRPSPALRMKTAIDPRSRRAANGQLFGYQAIPRGSRFGGWIEADDDLGNALFEQVIDALRGELLIGRSRSAEYGRAQLSDADFAPQPHGPSGRDDRQATLWLLADLAVQDADGQPTLEPLPEYLGLPPGRVIWPQSFIRSRRYSPWNGKRGAPDLERSVIQQGSVIRYQFDTTPDETLASTCANGLGLHREAGLGRVWLNPPLLDDDQPQFSPRPDTAPQTSTTARPQSALIDWLHTQQQGSEQDDRIEQQVSELFEQFQRTLGWAAGLQGLRPDADFGPSAQQWGRVLEAARNQPAERLLNTLFQGDSAIVKPSAEGWQEQYRDQRGQPVSLAAWLQQALSGIDAGQLPRVAQQLAHRCREAHSRRGGAR